MHFGLLSYIADALIQAGYIVKPFEPREDESAPTAILYDNSKSKKILGLEYSTPQKTAVDTYAELQKRFPESFPWAVYIALHLLYNAQGQKFGMYSIFGPSPLHWLFHA